MLSLHQFTKIVIHTLSSSFTSPKRHVLTFRLLLSRLIPDETVIRRADNNCDELPLFLHRPSLSLICQNTVASSFVLQQENGSASLLAAASHTKKLTFRYVSHAMFSVFNALCSYNLSSKR